MGKSIHISSIADLTSDPRNARRHNPRNVGMIEQAMGEVGAARSIVIDEDGVVLAGNATIEAAAQAGIERVQVVEADGNTIVAVRRSGLTPEQKTKLALYDNRAAELADWDAGVLAALAEETDLSALFRDDELSALLAAVPVEHGGGGDEFLEGANNIPQRVEYGDLWQLGDHLLLCGDSTKVEDIDRLMSGHRAALMASDPPYNVGIEYGEATDDEKAQIEYEAFTRLWFAAWQAVSDRQIVTPGCYNLASWCRWFDPYHVAPWTKTNAMTNGKVSRWWCWEPVLFFGAKWRRERTNDVFDHAVLPQTAQGISSLSGLHPCPKPLPMWVDLFESYSERGDIVADAFGGSGTAVIAAERIKRRARVCEIEPKYADLIVARWEAETGRAAIRV